MGRKAIRPVIGASVIAFATAFAMFVGVGAIMGGQGYARADESKDGEGKDLSKVDRQINEHARRTVDQGRQIFRFDTFGSEAFFGDALQLHKAIAGAKNGGVGPGVSPKTALAVGLKVDADALPENLKGQIKAGKVNLDDPATTLALLKLNAVVGLTGKFDQSAARSSRSARSARCATRRSTTPSRPASASAWTAGPIATSTSASSSRSHRTSSRSPIFSASTRRPSRKCSRAGVPGASTPSWTRTAKPSGPMAGRRARSFRRRSAWRA